MLNFPKKLVIPYIIKYGRRIEERRFKKEPIVIGACPRSGTTILLAILGAHPNIFAVPDQTYAFDKWEEVIEQETGKIVHKPGRLDRLYKEFIFYRIPESAQRWCEKTPKHIRSFKKILNYFDNKVKMINMVRDGRDVVTSKHPKHTPDQYWVSDKRWVKDVKLGLELADNPNVLTIRYEDLIQKFESQIKNICNFLDEPVSEKLYLFTQFTNLKRSKHLANPVENLYSNSIKRWQKTEHKNRIDLFMSNREAVNLLQKLGYQS